MPKQVFRSPALVVIWWAWVVFAVANLVDLAVQGGDHASLVAAFVLVLVTGIMYVAVWRPRIIAADDALTIVNPLRDHRVGWPAVARVDEADLVRVRCEWPEEPGEPGGQKTIYAWVAGTSKRRKYTAQLRAQRRARSRFGGIGVFGSAGGFAASGTSEPEPGDGEKIVSALTLRAEEMRSADSQPPAQPPASTWYWPGFAAIAIPALALLIAAFL